MIETTQGTEAFVQLSSLRFTYGASRGASADSSFELDCPTLEVRQGETLAIVGPSGSGKTTLLNLIAGLVLPRSGQVTVDRQTVNQLDEAARRAFRIRNIGFIFQDFQLLEYLSVRDNMSLPFRIHPAVRLTEQAREEITQVAQRLRIEHLLKRRVQRLSQGERQRVAIGRALVTKPRLILGDEPTGNLDVATRDTVMSLLLEQAAMLKATVIVVTHDQGILHRFDRVIDVRDLTQTASTVSSQAEETVS